MIQELHTPGIYQREMKTDVHRETTTIMQKTFIQTVMTTLGVIAQTGNNWYPWTDEWINNLACVPRNTAQQSKNKQ